MADKHIAVIDIGKTNKKIMIFDNELKILDSAYETFDEYVENGINLEDVANAFAWFKKQLAVFAKTYNIQALSITTHGATAVCIDAEGNLAAPPVAYTTEADDAFSDSFFEKFGDRVALQESTATAEIGSMINVAKLIYFIQQTWPDQFAKTRTILNYPQYFGYLFTGEIGAEPTYTGCHTYLFDFQDKTYSDVARDMGIMDLLPPKVSKSWEILGTISPAMSAETGLSEACVVTMGIHDSNSSLLPYLVKGYDNFVLNSTGTWCVAMHPTEGVSFKPEELGKLVFYNLDAFFNPVKTSIFMGGLEFSTYMDILHDIHKNDEYPGLHKEIVETVIREKRFFVLPSVVKGTGLFPDAKPRVVQDGEVYPLEGIQDGTHVPPFFNDFLTAHAAVNLSLALQTKTALDMVGFDGSGDVFTEGGFRRNGGYNALLTGLYPQSNVALTQLEEATAFGAAILAKAALEGTTPMETAACFDIGITPVERVAFPGLDAYEEAFFQHLIQG